MSFQEMLETVDEDGEGLTPWEVNFVADMIDRGETSPSAKAIAKLKQIYEARVP